MVASQTKWKGTAMPRSSKAYEAIIRPVHGGPTVSKILHRLVQVTHATSILSLTKLSYVMIIACQLGGTDRYMTPIWSCTNQWYVPVKINKILIVAKYIWKANDILVVGYEDNGADNDWTLC